MSLKYMNSFLCIELLVVVVVVFHQPSLSHSFLTPTFNSVIFLFHVT